MTRMTFTELAEYIAFEFKGMMADEGFDTFEEMKRCYCWDTQDIKEEVNNIIHEISSWVWTERRETVWMSDDLTFIQLNQDDISWKEFKKLLFKNLI